MPEGIRDSNAASPPFSAFLCHQWDIRCPLELSPPPTFPLPPHLTRTQTQAQAEEEHLEALFQPFTIVRITTSSQEMLLKGDDSLTAPRRRVRQRGRSKPV